MRKTFRKVALFSLVFALAQPMLTGCKDYDGDINNLQQQIDGLDGLNGTLADQLSAANTLANAANTKADQAAQQALDALTAANDVQAALDGMAESAKQEAIAAAAAAVAEDIKDLQDQIDSNGKTAQQAIQDAADNAANIAKVEGALQALQDEMAGLNNLSAQDVNDLINQAIKAAGFETQISNLTAEVALLNQTYQDLANEQAQIRLQMQALQNYENKINANSQAIAALQGDVQGLNSQIQSINSKLAAESANVAALQTAVAQLQASDSNLQSQLNSLNSDLSKIQSNVSGFQNEIMAVNANILTLQTGMLRGMIFFTDVYVGGIPALDYQVLNYYNYKFATANSAVTASLTYPGATATSAVTVPTATASNPIYTAANTPANPTTITFYPQLQAQYTLNPSTAVVTKDQLSITTRAITARANENDALGQLNIEDASVENGMLTLDLQYQRPTVPAGSTVSDPLSGNVYAGTHNSMLFGLVAEFEVEGQNEQGQKETVTNTVTSDWGLFNPVLVTPSKGGSIVYANPVQANVKPIDNPNYSITVNQTATLPAVNNNTLNPLYYTDLDNVTNATSAVAGLTDALTNSPTAMVPYNSTLDLNDEVLMAFTLNSNGDTYYFSMTPAELSKYNLTMNYKLINYTVAGQTYDTAHAAGESSYVTLSDGVLTPNPNTSASLGHMPVVMIYVTDANNNLVALSFLKVIISLPMTEAPTINPINLGVYPFNPGANEWSTVAVNYNTLVANAQGGASAMKITQTQWINNYVTAPTYTTSPNVANYGTVTKDANGNLTLTLSTADDYIDIWQAPDHKVTVYATFKSNVTNLGDITVPFVVEVSRAQVPLGEKIPNLWNDDYSVALATLIVRNTGTIGTTTDQFSILLPALFNNKEVLEYDLNAVSTTPGPIYVNSANNLYKQGLYPSLQLQNASALTVADNAWTLTTPGTYPTLPEVAYNFYLNQLNNTTVQIAQGWLEGSYTLSVENKAANVLTSEEVLNNPFAVTTSGTEYNNTVVYATGSDGVKHTVLELDQTTGYISIGAESATSTTPDPVALAIMNEVSSIGYNSLLSAQIGISAWGNNNWAVSVLDNMFTLNFLRPINIIDNTVAPTFWNQRPMTFNISNYLTVRDIPGVTPFTAANYAWFDAYQIDLDLPNAVYIVEGKEYSVTDYLDFSSGSTTAPKYVNAFTGQVYTPTTTYNGTDPVSVWATPTSGTPNYGDIIFDSSSPKADAPLVITKLTTIEIPAALTYSWGSIFFTLSIQIEPAPGLPNN